MYGAQPRGQATVSCEDAAMATCGEESQSIEFADDDSDFRCKQTSDLGPSTTAGPAESDHEQPGSRPELQQSDKSSEDRKIARMLKNRQSAKRSREIARQHVAMLEQNLNTITKESQVLLNRLALVEAENQHLRQAQLLRQTISSGVHVSTYKKARWG